MKKLSPAREKNSESKRPAKRNYANDGVELSKKDKGFDTIPAVIEEIRHGRMVIVTDDEDLSLIHI